MQPGQICQICDYGTFTSRSSFPLYLRLVAKSHFKSSRYHRKIRPGQKNATMRPGLAYVPGAGVRGKNSGCPQLRWKLAIYPTPVRENFCRIGFRLYIIPSLGNAGTRSSVRSEEHREQKKTPSSLCTLLCWFNRKGEQYAVYIIKKGVPEGSISLVSYHIYYVALLMNWIN